ncbi:MAG: stage V sporulation protein AE [Peptococcaceae bacterium]|nr:stage V sporulation protein AE [Peptococcaceae bacterium]
MVINRDQAGGQSPGGSGKRNVILVTDGDRAAKRAIEAASRNIGARCISCSAGNPTRLTGEQLVALIKEAPHDPVVVMLDDRGFHGRGKGERALEYLAGHPGIRVLGVLAVASNTEFTESVEVDCSVTSRGGITPAAVDKNGEVAAGGAALLSGDTVEVLGKLDIPVVIGIGDIGKMNGADDPDMGAPLTTRAFEEILDRSGFYDTGG